MGSRVQRDYDREFKLWVVGRMDAGEQVKDLSRALGVGATCLYRWHRQYRQGGEIALRARGRRPDREALLQPAVAVDDLDQARARIAELERKVGRQELELDFFQRALRATEEARPLSVNAGATESTGSSDQ